MSNLNERIKIKISHLEKSNYVCPEYNLIINILKECMEELSKKNIEINQFVVDYIETMIKAVKFNREDLQVNQLFYSSQRQEEFMLLLTDVEKLLKSIVNNTK